MILAFVGKKMVICLEIVRRELTGDKVVLTCWPFPGRHFWCNREVMKSPAVQIRSVQVHRFIKLQKDFRHVFYYERTWLITLWLYERIIAHLCISAFLKEDVFIFEGSVHLHPKEGRKSFTCKVSCTTSRQPLERSLDLCSTETPLLCLLCRCWMTRKVRRVLISCYFSMIIGNLNIELYSRFLIWIKNTYNRSQIWLISLFPYSLSSTNSSSPPSWICLKASLLTLCV